MIKILIYYYIKQNRQYNNELIINFIETNANKTYDKDTYLLLLFSSINHPLRLVF